MQRWKQAEIAAQNPTYLDCNSAAVEAMKRLATVVQPPDVAASGEYLEIKDLLDASQIETPHSSGKNHPHSKVKKLHKPNVQK